MNISILIWLLSYVIAGNSSQIQQEAFEISPNIMMDSTRIVKLWEEVDSLHSNNLTQSLDNKLDELIPLLSLESNPFLWVKAHIYKAKVIQRLNEDGVFLSMEYLEARKENASDVAENILYAALANMYGDYLKQNLFTLAERKQVERSEYGDVRQWTATEFMNTATQYFIKSIDNERLKDYTLADASVLVSDGKHAERIVTNLYELLLAEALYHFSEPSNLLHVHLNSYKMNDPILFADYRDFSSTTLLTLDSLHTHFQALLLYQKALNTFSKNTEALVHFEMKRLAFLREHSSIANKKGLYRNRIFSYLNEFKNHPSYVEIAYEAANLLRQEGGQYRPLDSSTHHFQLALVEADSILADAEVRFPEAYGIDACKSLRQELNQKEWSLTFSDRTLSGKPFLGSLSFRNTKSLDINIYQINETEKRDLQRLSLKDRKVFFDDRIIHRKQTVDLPIVVDLQPHRADIIIEGLGKGLYAVFGSGENISPEQWYRGIQYLEVTDIQFITRSDDSDQLGVWVVSALDGSPIVGAEVKAFEYVYKNRNLEKTILQTAVSDEQGKVTFDYKNSIQVEASYEGSYIQSNSIYQYEGYKRRNKRALLMTDRAIYRPGQIVYFKGIAYEDSVNGVPELLKNQSVIVKLVDANYKEIATRQMRSSNLGSFHGQFVLPTGGLTGQYSIQIEQVAGDRYFRVEEYKRPNFEVTLKEPSEALVIGQEIKVSGSANKFAGTPVRRAKVDYVVQMSIFYPMLPWRYRFFPLKNETIDVAVGSLETDNQGGFLIDFKALGEEESRQMNPFYRYKIVASVTDNTGETRSGELFVTLGSIPYILSMQLPDKVLASKLRSIPFEITNAQGQPAEAEASIKIEELKAPKRLIIDNGMPEADIYLYSESEFKSKLPHSPFKGEDKYENWEVIREMHNEVIPASNEKVVTLDASRYPSGVYRVTLQINKDPNQPQKVQYIKIINKDVKANNGFNSVIETLASSTDAEPGETLEYVLSSTSDKVCVLLAVEKNGRIAREGWKQVKGVYSFDIEVDESDRGGLFIHHVYGGANSFVYETQRVDVPWSNKQLDIKWLTERKKLEPGSDEIWSFKVSGTKQPEVEVTAAMYDVSLDAFVSNYWERITFPSQRSERYFSNPAVKGQSRVSLNDRNLPFNRWLERQLPVLQLFGLTSSMYGYLNVRSSRSDMYVKMEAPPQAEMAMSSDDSVESTDAEPVDIDGKSQTKAEVVPTIRENLNETVFFYPDLITDKEGKFELTFKMNEALTRWKLMLHAHDKNLASGYSEYFIKTQKELMVFPNVPRFLRQRDTILLMMSIENLSEKSIEAYGSLDISDAISGISLNHWIMERDLSRLNINTNDSHPMSWTVVVPEDFTGLIKLRYSAEAGNQTDAEEHIIPVLTNRKLISENVNLWVNGGESKTFSMSDVNDKFNTEGRVHHKFTLELTDNPTWYAVLALPYMSEAGLPNADAIISRYYANSLASDIVQKIPKLQSIFNQWKNSDGLLSELEKNQDLKMAILNETPWVRDAQNETDQRSRIAMLFEMNTLNNQLRENIKSLQELQNDNGGFPWYPGGRENWYTTQNIVEHLGHLDHLGVKNVREDQDIRKILLSAIGFLDREIIRYYERDQQRLNKNELYKGDASLSSIVIHYLYTRSFFPDIPQSASLTKVTEFYLDQIEKKWATLSIYQQGLSSLVLFRNLRTGSARKILLTLSENMIRNEELGYYWKYNHSYLWYEVPIQTHALMIEAFHEVLDRPDLINGMKKWLLKNKQTTSWPGQKSTVMAIFALLSTGDNWLQSADKVKLWISDKPFDVSTDQKLAGSGYTKQTISKDLFDFNNPSIRLENSGAVPAWGGFYWQYFQEIDKVNTFNDYPIKLEKKLYKLIQDDRGQRSVEISGQHLLKIGDVINIRIEISVDRPLEFVHLRDMRASGLEPLEALSGYRWSSGLGYYLAIRDTGADFFFDFIPPGDFVFEYQVRVFNAGNLANGIAEIQSFYAPQFSAHSSGQRILVSSLNK